MIYCIHKINMGVIVKVMPQNKIIEFIQPDAQDWEKLERISEIDMQGFGKTAFRLSIFPSLPVAAQYSALPSTD